MTQLDFAMWDAVGGYETEGRVFADVLEDHLRLAQRVEELGWTYYFCIEHQNSPVGRITAPTVSNLFPAAQLHGEEWFSVESVITEATVRDLIPKLIRAGAVGIVEYPLNKVI